LGTVQLPSLMSQHQISQGYHPSLSSMFHRQSHTSHSIQRGSDVVAHNLKTVSFPRDCMNWFTSIASINTVKNKETCGLLLGKEKGGRYVVTTLLIPKQHATSDTCAIDEEELVTQATEERSLITLGWVRRSLYWWTRAQCSLVCNCQIHTHPTQSCMCSVEILGRAMT
jgi:STAM-binding protein